MNDILQPAVSICIPTYNGAKYLEEALQSVEIQTFRDFEVVISDDNSKDETMDIIQKFKDRNEFHVEVLHHVPSTIGANWNHAILHAKGEFIKLLFQDDLLESDCLEKMVKVAQNPDIGMVVSKRKIIETNLSELHKDWKILYSDLQVGLKIQWDEPMSGKEVMRQKNFFYGPTNRIGEPPAVLFPKKITSVLGLFDEELNQSLDIEYWLRILQRYDVVFLKEELVSFRLHADQASMTNKALKKSDYSAIVKIIWTKYRNYLPLEKYFFYWFKSTFRSS